MRTVFFLLSFILFISIEVNAQQNSVVPNDSIPSITVPDSLSPIILSNHSLHFPTMGPWYYDSINLSKLFISSIIFKSPYTPKGARKDIRNGEPVILFSGEYGKIPDFSSKEDKRFQQKYGVEFKTQGWVRLPNEDQEGYNQVIFAYLDKKYGEDWRYELSEGAVGFDNPEQKTIQDNSIAEVASPLAMQLANPQTIDSQAPNPETETSVWWYILPTSGFALLLGLYLIKRKKD